MAEPQKHEAGEAQAVNLPRQSVGFLRDQKLAPRDNITCSRTSWLVTYITPLSQFILFSLFEVFAHAASNV
jgi:hypothetical protein